MARVRTTSLLSYKASLKSSLDTASKMKRELKHGWIYAVFMISASPRHGEYKNCEAGVQAAL